MSLDYRLLEFGDKKGKVYLGVNVETQQIIVDTKFLPETAFLCACFDCQEMYSMDVGKDNEDKRTFIDIDWVINEWGGPKDLIEAIKRRKASIIKSIPQMKEGGKI